MFLNLTEDQKQIEKELRITEGDFVDVIDSYGTSGGINIVRTNIMLIAQHVHIFIPGLSLIEAFKIVFRDLIDNEENRVVGDRLDTKYIPPFITGSLLSSQIREHANGIIGRMLSKEILSKFNSKEYGSTEKKS